MTHRANICVSLSLAVVGSSATAAPDQPKECWDRPSPAPKVTLKLKSGDVISLAKAAAAQKGYDLSKFKPPTVCFDSPERKWVVFYDAHREGDVVVLGNHFHVTVEDLSRILDVIPGE